VANSALKTPTAVADFIIDCVNDTENHFIEHIKRISDLSGMIILRNRNILDGFRIKLIPVSRVMISKIKDNLSLIIISAVNTGKEFILKSGIIPSNQKSRMLTGSKAFIAAKASVLEGKTQNLTIHTTNTMNGNKSRLVNYEENLNILTPDNVLRRGYTITSLNGRILKSNNRLQEEDVIVTQFYVGEISSRVLRRMGRKGEREKGRKGDIALP
jgi:exodeoxyribonuclease VII large subunit